MADADAGTSWACHRCRMGLSAADFEGGRAITLLGHQYCDACLAQAILKQRNRRSGSDEEPKPVPFVTGPPVRPKTRILPPGQLEAEAVGRREFSRFIPPADCALVLKHEGWRGLLESNLVQLWVDVSEGGFRAIISGDHRRDDRLRGEMRYPPRNVRHEFRVCVRHVKPCTAYPGCTIVGFQFEEPTAELRGFIRECLAETPSIALETRRRPKSNPDTPPAAARPA